MFEIKELIETGLRKGTNAESILTIISNNIDNKVDSIDMYENLYHEIHGSHLCDDFCIKFVDMMYNDFERGKKWSIDQTNDIARKIGIAFDDEYSQYEFWCVMHMMYYKYSEVLKESGITDVSVFGKMADAYFVAPFMPKGHLVSDFFFIERNK